MCHTSSTEQATAASNRQSVKKEATGVVRLGTRYSSLFANMVQYVQAAYVLILRARGTHTGQNHGVDLF